MRSESIEAVGSDGLGLRLEFRWHSDRYAHLISRIEPGRDPEPLLESIEGATSNTWPPSPPLQSLTFQTLPNGVSAALLVGMAGRSHWSASIEAVPNTADLIFDVACRHSDRPLYLGSQYRILASAEKTFVVRGLDSEIHQQAERLLIQPQMATAGSPTTRWKFVVSLNSTEY
ncbi:MAG TPA: hypothetical protein VGI40_27895 [Pirellulaceae bacterium]